MTRPWRLGAPRASAMLLATSLALWACDQADETSTDGVSDATPGAGDEDIGGPEADAPEDDGAIGEADADGGPSAFCEPGERFCASPSTVGVCGDDGIAWATEEICGGGEVCQPDSATCEAVSCEPGTYVCLDDLTQAECNAFGTGPEQGVACAAQETCVAIDGCTPWLCNPGVLWCDEAGGLSTCDADGLGWTPTVEPCEGDSCVFCRAEGSVSCTVGVAEEAAPVPCTDTQTCVTGEGCVDWACVPAESGCMDYGAAAVCGADGLGWEEALGFVGCTQLPSCVQCLDFQSYVSCYPGADAPSPSLTTLCPPETTCLSNVGCEPWICTPGEGQCKAGKVYSECEPSGLAWKDTPCSKYATCVAEGATQGCDAGDPVGSDAMVGCSPLPPFNDGTWTVPDDWQTLKVTFGVGILPDASKVFVNLSPVVNPLTGGYLDGLVPVTTGPAGVTSGNIAIYEDGEPREVSCVPLVNTDYAMTDIVFILDVTGSMSGTIQKVKDSAVDLAAYLAEKGQDVRFGLIPYDDYVPAQDGGGDFVLPFIADAVQFETFVEQNITATGGGDGPENALDAFEYALEGPPLLGNGNPVGPALVWRKGAQRAFVLMTDATMHHWNDGSSFTDVKLVELIGDLKGSAVVHTVSGSNGSDPWGDGTHPDARSLSCATGGTASNLGDFDQAVIEEALFAKAIAQSYTCFYTSSSPFQSHDVTVSITYEQGGQEMSGETLQAGVTYTDDAP